MRYLILFAFVFAFSFLFGQTPKVTAGKIIHYEDFSSNYVDPRNVDLWLPDGYSTDKKYAVLYMHDGQMLFDSTITWNGQEWGVDETMTLLLKEGKIKDCIVVGIWNNDEYRRSEYLPQKALGFLPRFVADSIIDSVLMGKAQANNYLKFIARELKPFIDETYSTYSDRDNTYIMGSSMGGLISMYAICEYPEIFGGAACLSTHWYGEPISWNSKVPKAYLHYIKNHLPDPTNHKLYFDHGDQTLDQYYEPFQKEADIIILDAGFSKPNFKTLKFPGQAHTEDAWAGRLHTPMLFLLGKN